MGNALVPVIMILWVPITLLLFSRFSARLASLVSLLGACLFLPAGYAFDLRGMPPLDREVLASLAMVIGVLVYHSRLPNRRPPLQGAEILVLMMALGAFGTALTNDDPVDIGTRILPGLRVWDGVSMTADAVLTFAVPFYLGRLVFRQPRDLELQLWALVVAGIGYSLFIGWEARMSPHLHYHLYGYQPGAFGQSKRGSWFGWRPMAFVGHGLQLAVFVVTTALAATTLWRARRRKYGLPLGPVMGYLCFIVALCSSLAALVYTLVVVPLIALSSRGSQRTVLLVLSFLVLAYPSLRGSDAFPTQALADAASAYASPERAESLQFRFDNEDILLERARQRIAFGWGAFGRDRVFDPLTGIDLSVTDGFWIIALGQRGVVGLAAAFGMLLYPVILACLRSRSGLRPVDATLVLGTAWIVCVSAVDLLPNGFLNARTVFFAGALHGALQGARQPVRRRPARQVANAPTSAHVPVGHRAHAGRGGALGGA